MFDFCIIISNKFLNCIPANILLDDTGFTHCCNRFCTSG